MPDVVDQPKATSAAAVAQRRPLWGDAGVLGDRRKAPEFFSRLARLRSSSLR